MPLFCLQSRGQRHPSLTVRGQGCHNDDRDHGLAAVIVAAVVAVVQQQLSLIQKLSPFVNVVDQRAEIIV